MSALGDLNTAVDELAELVINDESLVQPLLDARDEARAVENSYPNYYLDLRDLGAVLAESDETALQPMGQAIVDSNDKAVIISMFNNPKIRDKRSKRIISNFGPCRRY